VHEPDEYDGERQQPVSEPPPLVGNSELPAPEGGDDDGDQSDQHDPERERAQRLDARIEEGGIRRAGRHQNQEMSQDEAEGNQPDLPVEVQQRVQPQRPGNAAELRG
jgi:hypothetical protein